MGLRMSSEGVEGGEGEEEGEGKEWREVDVHVEGGGGEV